MLKNKPWTRKKLTEMLYHAFIGSLADNAIEIGWVLCFSLLADKNLVERINSMRFHLSMRPFDYLTDDVQDLDTPYVEKLNEVLDYFKGLRDLARCRI